MWNIHISICWKLPLSLSLSVECSLKTTICKYCVLWLFVIIAYTILILTAEVLVFVEQLAASTPEAIFCVVNRSYDKLSSILL